MTRTTRALFLSLTLVLLGCRDTYEVERTDYQSPALDDHGLVDDKLDDKKPAFDETRVDTRPLDGWLVNASAAVIALDTPAIKPDQEPALLALHPSYAAASRALEATGRGSELVPSVNAIDGLAKQFDDGCVAAIELAYYRGLEQRLASHVEVVRTLHDALPEGPARAYLAAALELAGAIVPANDPARRAWLLRFEAAPERSKPIGFWTWRDELSRAFRMLRLLQWEFAPDDLAIPRALAAALTHDAALCERVKAMVAFYERLTGPRLSLSVCDVAGRASGDDTAALARELGVPRPSVALLPSSRSREQGLFERLFPRTLPPDAQLMKALVAAIRSGAIDLAPTADSGWLEHQVYALETLLLPQRGRESERLLLSKAYKQRMLQAFQALVTKRKETHVRQGGIAVGSAPAPLAAGALMPRLRIEPAPTFYLRTARGYVFLRRLLEGAIGNDGLDRLKGLTADGERAMPLGADLVRITELFYGLYLLSAEDIGLAVELVAGEADPVACRARAEAWLATWTNDPDLAADVRVAVPVYVDPTRRRTRTWATLGVRLVRLDARYARPPHTRPAAGAAPWKLAEPRTLSTARVLIAVDEFAEIDLPGLAPLTRDELRRVCDRERTKGGILAALERDR